MINSPAPVVPTGCYPRIVATRQVNFRSFQLSLNCIHGLCNVHGYIPLLSMLVPLQKLSSLNYQSLNTRKSINESEPQAYKAMLNLEMESRKFEVSPVLRHLIKIRASQINGCAYCVDMHTEEALKSGESPRRIFAISVWHESHLFTEEERAVLQLTEEVTRIHEKGVSDETYERVVNLFGEQAVAQLIMLAVIINSWNRIAVSTRQIFKK